MPLPLLTKSQKKRRKRIAAQKSFYKNMSQESRREMEKTLAQTDTKSFSKNQKRRLRRKRTNLQKLKEADASQVLATAGVKVAKKQKSTILLAVASATEHLQDVLAKTKKALKKANKKIRHQCGPKCFE